jgi:hypothetical protein
MAGGLPILLSLSHDTPIANRGWCFRAGLAYDSTGLKGDRHG